MTEPPEIFVARDSAFVEVEPEPAWRPLLRFTIVTALCIALLVVALALTIVWLQSWGLWSCGGFGGTDAETYPDAYVYSEDAGCMVPISSR
ncbi:hypothetical protein [Mycetocola sp.]|uniref:hypothetical protein n=1 Tax=Mycetocola sp. TaxID=1871042 RepID=UPI003989A648